MKCWRAPAILVFLGVNLLCTVGCNQQPAAASNEVFTAREAFGPTGKTLVAQQPALNDVLASRVLDSHERAQVRSALESMVHGNISPLEAAKDGVRFSDVPRAAQTAASAVEMAVISTQHLWPKVELDYIDRDGYTATLEVTLDDRFGSVSVNYLVPNESSRLARAEILAGMTESLATITKKTSANVRDKANRVIADHGGQVFETREFPERYTVSLLMLDSQPAGLEVTRLDSSEVLKWEVWAGLFSNKEESKKLSAAFKSALKAWGRVPRYVQGS